VRRLLALLLVPLLFLATACGDSDDGGDSGDSADGASSTEPFNGVTVTGEPGEEPEVAVDEPFTVDETSAEVLDEGDGEEVVEGDSAVLQYTGINGASGEEFDSSWSRGEPATFPLTEGQLIPGFLDGLVGQTYGSRVALAITPDDAYGPSGGYEQLGIGEDDTLLFVVDLIEPAAKPLAMAEGTEQDPPAGLPELELDDKGVPTGFTATKDTDKTVPDLVVAPVIVGEGPELEEGQTATVHYVGQIYPDGKVFDESWTSGQPAEFPLTPGGLIQGFLDGLIGQTVGSRIIIAIPSEEGYGKEGSPPDIGPNEDLIFVVDVLAAS